MGRAGSSIRFAGPPKSITSNKEIVLLKKIDEKTILLRATQDGKFTDPGGRIVYCPEEQQRMYEESKKVQ